MIPKFVPKWRFGILQTNAEKYMEMKWTRSRMKVIPLSFDCPLVFRTAGVSDNSTFGIVGAKKKSFKAISSTQLVWLWFSWTSVTTLNLRNHCHHFTPTLYYILVVLLGSLQSYLYELFTYLVPFGNTTWKRVKQNVHNQAISTRCCALTRTFSNTLWWYFLLWRL